MSKLCGGLFQGTLIPVFIFLLCGLESDHQRYLPGHISGHMQLEFWTWRTLVSEEGSATSMVMSHVQHAFWVLKSLMIEADTPPSTLLWGRMLYDNKMDKKEATCAWQEEKLILLQESSKSGLWFSVKGWKGFTEVRSLFQVCRPVLAQEWLLLHQIIFWESCK